MSSETTPFTSKSGKPSTMEIKRQYSYTTLARLLGDADSKPQSPATPSPCGAAQIKKVVQRLEEIDAESRELLQRLFSMLETDARLERYVKRRLRDPKVSRMWELVEQILSSQRGNIDVDALLNNKKIQDGEDENNVLLVDHGLRELKFNEDEDEMRVERFKIRTFGTADVIDERER